MGIDMTTESAPSKGSNGTNLGTMAGRSPAKEVKGYLRNLILYDDVEPGEKEFNDTLEFWFRPSIVREQGSANYTESEILGLSHKVRKFSSTNNFKFMFDLYFNSLMRLKEYSIENERRYVEGDYNDMRLISEDIENKRRFIEALLIPYRAASGMLAGENPPALLVIPGIVSLRGKLDTFNFEFRDVTIEGNIKEMMCRIEFTEEPLGRITMREHLATGCLRTWGS